MKQMVKRIPLFWKYIAMSILIMVAFYLSFLFFVNRVLFLLKDTLHVFVPVKILSGDFIYFFVWAAILSTILLLLMYADIKHYLVKINQHFLYSIARKRMIPNLEEFQSKDIFQDITKNANQMFSLFRHYDQMKSSRIFLEVTSIKSLINALAEGVIFMNEDKIVTHINHKAEEMFRLIPGEVTGEVFSRHVNNSALIQNIDLAISNDQKLTDIPIKIRDDQVCMVTILPIKNKSNELIRAIIVASTQSTAIGGNGSASSKENRLK